MMKHPSDIAVGRVRTQMVEVHGQLDYKLTHGDACYPIINILTATNSPNFLVLLNHTVPILLEYSQTMEMFG